MDIKTPKKKTRKKCSKCGEDQFNTPSGMCCPNGHGGADSMEPKPKKKKKTSVFTDCGKSALMAGKMGSIFYPEPGGDYNEKNVKLFLRKINEKIAPIIIVAEDLNPSYKIPETKTRMFRVDVCDNTYLHATVYTSRAFKDMVSVLFAEIFAAEPIHNNTGALFWFVSSN